MLLGGGGGQRKVAVGKAEAERENKNVTKICLGLKIRNGSCGRKIEKNRSKQYNKCSSRTSDLLE